MRGIVRFIVVYRYGFGNQGIARGSVVMTPELKDDHQRIVVDRVDALVQRLAFQELASQAFPANHGTADFLTQFD